jgi:predicted MFS family arabinose efflux permease
MVGPLVGGLLSDAAGFMPTFVVASALSAVGCGLYYRYVPEPYPHPGPTPPRLEAATEGSRL